SPYLSSTFTLFFLYLSAHHRDLHSFPTRRSSDLNYRIFARKSNKFMSVKGTLIPIGGNEDKGIEQSEIYTLEYIQEGILSRVVRESGGKEALIVVIPTASSIPNEVSENYLQAFGKLGCENVHIMDIRNRAEAEDPLHLDLMKKADCVMFSGGDQS